MKKTNLARFVLAIVLLLLLQGSQTLIEENFLHQESRSNESLNGTKVLNKNVHLRQKRFIGAIARAIGTAAAAGAAVASTSLSIYRSVRRCKDITPHLKPRIQQSKKKVQTLKVKKKKLEKFWKLVEKKIEALKQLEKDLVHIRTKISEYDALRIAIVKLLDRNIIDKMNSVGKHLNNDIDNQKETLIGSLKQLEDKFFSASEYAFLIAANIVNLGIVGRGIIMRQLNSFTSNQARNWATKNNGRVSKMLNNYVKLNPKMKNWAINKKIIFKTNLNLKWSKFGTKFPRFKTGLSKLGRIGSKLGTGLSAVGKVLGKVVPLAMLGFDIWSFVRHTKECKKKMRAVDKALLTLKDNEREMKRISAEVSRANINVGKYYREMTQNIINDNFKSFLEDVVNLGKGAQHQDKDIKAATNTIIQYIRMRKYFFDKNFVAYYNKRLIGSFEKINYKLHCFKSKLEVRTTVIDNCAKGVSSFSVLYNDAKRLESQIDKNCLKTGYMSKPEIKRLVELAMEKKNLQKNCIRNSASKIGIVCLSLSRRKTIKEISRIISATTDDVRYFSNQCKLSLSDQQKMSICMKKGQKFTISEVLNKYHRKVQNEARNFYGKCKISLQAKDQICKLKYDGYKLPDVEKKWNIYTATLVKSVFNECTKLKKMTPIDIQRVCAFKSAGFSLEEAPFRMLTTKYIPSAIYKQYQVC